MLTLRLVTHAAVGFCCVFGGGTPSHRHQSRDAAAIETQAWWRHHLWVATLCEARLRPWRITTFWRLFEARLRPLESYYILQHCAKPVWGLGELLLIFGIIEIIRIWLKAT